jgi:hypothetical protein
MVDFFCNDKNPSAGPMATAFGVLVTAMTSGRFDALNPAVFQVCM